MSIWERLERTNPRYIYLAMALAISIPLLYPIGLPVYPNPHTTMPVYSWIESLNPGDIVFLDASYDTYFATEMNPQVEAWFAHCVKKGVKVVGVAQSQPGASIAWDILCQVAEDLARQGFSATYGSDWVYVGWKAGAPEVWRAMQGDFWTATGAVDYQGNSFDDLPLMARVSKWDTETCKGIMVFGLAGAHTYLTYFTDYQIYLGSISSTVVNDINYIRSGQIKGLLSGIRSAAEYEALIDRLGDGTRFMDSQTGGHLIIIFLIAIGNVAYFRRKGVRR